MKIEEKNVEVVIAVMAEKIRTLETDVWFRDEQIKHLKTEIELLKETNNLKGAQK